MTPVTTPPVSPLTEPHDSNDAAHKVPHLEILGARVFPLHVEGIGSDGTDEAAWAFLDDIGAFEEDPTADITSTEDELTFRFLAELNAAMSDEPAKKTKKSIRAHRYLRCPPVPASPASRKDARWMALGLPQQCAIPDSTLLVFGHRAHV